jgi:hypothetical protein
MRTTDLVCYLIIHIIKCYLFGNDLKVTLMEFTVLSAWVSNLPSGNFIYLEGSSLIFGLLHQVRNPMRLAIS